MRNVWIKVIIVTTIVLLVLFGLYWGGRKLVAPEGEEIMEVSVECDDVYTSVSKAVADFNKLNKKVCGLDLSGRKMPGLTAGIGFVTSLTTLDVSGNNVKQLPEWIGDLRGLNNLNLSGNKLTALPEEIVALKNLKVLDLTGNPLPQEEVDKVRKLLPNTEVKFYEGE